VTITYEKPTDISLHLKCYFFSIRHKFILVITFKRFGNSGTETIWFFLRALSRRWGPSGIRCSLSAMLSCPPYLWRNLWADILTLLEMSKPVPIVALFCHSFVRGSLLFWIPVHEIRTHAFACNIIRPPAAGMTFSFLESFFYPGATCCAPTKATSGD
jgi:hypothetical protein